MTNATPNQIVDFSNREKPVSLSTSACNNIKNSSSFKTRLHQMSGFVKTNVIFFFTDLKVTIIFFFTITFITVLEIKNYKHCAKSVQMRGFFWSVFFCIRTEYKKIRIRKNSVFGHFSFSERIVNIHRFFNLQTWFEKWKRCFHISNKLCDDGFSLFYKTSARHERQECDTNNMTATRVNDERHECDTSVTRTTRVRYECYKNDVSATRVKKFDFHNNTSENIFSPLH